MVKFMVELVDLLYPVGSIYISTNNTNPSLLFGGTWKQIKDKFLLSCGDTYNNGATGGSANATLVRHNHYPSGENYFVTNDTDSASNYRVGNATSGRWVDGQTNSGTFHHTQATNFVGSDGTGKNMPPYLAVYVWERISDEEEQGETEE